MSWRPVKTDQFTASGNPVTIDLEGDATDELDIPDPDNSGSHGEVIYTVRNGGTANAWMVVSADLAVLTFTFSGTPEVGDDMNITINGVLGSHTVDSAVLNDEVGDLRTALTTALAAEPVTVGGAAAVVTVTADDERVWMTGTASINLVASGSLAVAESPGLETADNIPSGDERVIGPYRWPGRRDEVRLRLADGADCVVTAKLRGTP
jgi:hypothetical protein